MNCLLCGKSSASLDRFGLCPDCSPYAEDPRGEIWEEPELAPEEIAVPC